MINYDEGIALYVYSAESLKLAQVKIRVTGCRYRQTHVRVAISRPLVSQSLFGGSKKGYIFLVSD